MLFQGGMSLVELMVTMVIALFISLAIFSVLHVFESRKRSSTSVNDINQAGNYAAYALDKLVRGAGSGFAQGDGATFGCAVTAARNGAQVLPRTAALPAPFASVNTGTANVFKLIPLVIVPGATTPAVSGVASDVLIVMGGQSGLGETAAKFSSAPTATQLNLSSTMGFKGGDQILVSDLSAAPSGDPCLIEEVASGFSGGASSALLLQANSGNSSYYYQATVNATSLVSFSDAANDVAFNLGNVADGNPPVFAVLGVGENNTLFGFDLLQNQNPVSGGTQMPYSIADGVFEMHARYGVDTDDDGKVDSWLSATGDYAPASLTSGSESAFKMIRRIKAVRVALLMRTSIPEKDTVSNFAASECNKAEDAISYFCTLASATRSLDEDEQHYRYRVIETAIPLRNTVMVDTADG
jgi:type IV pilus assembly protein PilW